MVQTYSLNVVHNAVEFIMLETMVDIGGNSRIPDMGIKFLICWKILGC